MNDNIEGLQRDHLDRELQEVKELVRKKTYAFHIRSYLKDKGCSEGEIQYLMTWAAKEVRKERVAKFARYAKVLFPILLIACVASIVFFWFYPPENWVYSFPLGVAITGAVVMVTLSITLLVVNQIRKIEGGISAPNIREGIYVLQIIAFFIVVIMSAILYFYYDNRNETDLQRNAVFSTGEVISRTKLKVPVPRGGDFTVSSLTIRYAIQGKGYMVGNCDIPIQWQDRYPEGTHVRVVYSSLHPDNFDLITHYNKIDSYYAEDERMLEISDLEKVYTLNDQDILPYLENVSKNWYQDEMERKWVNENHRLTLIRTRYELVLKTEMNATEYFHKRLKASGYERQPGLMLYYHKGNLSFKLESDWSDVNVDCSLSLMDRTRVPMDSVHKMYKDSLGQKQLNEASYSSND